MLEQKLRTQDSYRPTSLSMLAGNQADQDWLPDFVDLVRGQLDQAKAITNHLFGLQQFQIGKPIWESYLKGEEKNPRVAMQNVVDALQAEMKRG